MKLFHVGGLEILYVVLLADALGRGVMLSSDKLVMGGTLFETFQQIENAALAVVEKEDTEVAPEVLVPKSVLVVKETQVADDAEYRIVSNTREAGSCRQRTVDAIHTTIAVDTMLCENVGQSDGSAIGIVNRR